jgi:hypothetical protein
MSKPKSKKSPIQDPTNPPDSYWKVNKNWKRKGKNFLCRKSLQTGARPAPSVLLFVRQMFSDSKEFFHAIQNIVSI